MADDQRVPFERTQAAVAVEDDLRTAESLQSLLQLPGIGAAGAIRLANEFRSWPALLAASPDRIGAVAGTRIDAIWRPANGELPEDTRTVGWFDDAFPQLLKQIPDPPALLWVRGAVPDPEARVAVAPGNPRPGVSRWPR